MGCSASRTSTTEDEIKQKLREKADLIITRIEAGEKVKETVKKQNVKLINWPDGQWSLVCNICEEFTCDKNLDLFMDIQLSPCFISGNCAMCPGHCAVEHHKKIGYYKEITEREEEVEVNISQTEIKFIEDLLSRLDKIRKSETKTTLGDFWDALIEEENRKSQERYSQRLRVIQGIKDYYLAEINKAE